MKSRILQNYKFESIVSKDVGLYPITDEEMTYIPNSISDFTARYCNFPYGQKILKKVIVQPLGTASLIGLVNIYDDSTIHTLSLSPWRYSTISWTAANKKLYLNTPEEIKIMQSAGFYVKQTGRWYKRLDTCTVVRTRFFAPPPTLGDYRSQYTFDVILYDNGIFEYRYQSLESSLTRKGFKEEYDNLKTKIYVNDVFQSPDYVISVVDFDLKDQNFDLGGKRLADASFAAEQDASEVWPGKLDNGAIYRFTPPPDKIKKILPRRLLRRQDTNSLISSPGMYDDRKTIPFVNQSITMPSRMPTLYGQLSTIGTTEYQINSDFYLTGVVEPSAVEQWITSGRQFELTSMSPFAENNFLEENIKSLDFYKTGSRVEDVGLGFDNSLDHKVKISYELPINNSYTLTSSSASLVYYDQRSAGFSQSGVVEGFYTYYNAFGDAKLYSAFGKPIAGGYDPNSTGVYYKYTTSYSDDLLSEPNVLNEVMRVVQKTNTNISASHSFTSASYPSYSGSNVNGIQSIIFNNDLSAPFLLEKAIIEIPFCAGPGWLNDTTKASRIVSKPYGGGFDRWKFSQEGGPCVTVGLIRENWEGKLKDYGYYTQGDPNYVFREVICSGTMIPQRDNTDGYHFTIDNYSSGLPAEYEVTLMLSGFNSYSDSPSCVISANNGNYFTGSARFNLIPQVVNNYYYNYRDSNCVGLGGAKLSPNLDTELINLADEIYPGKFQNYKPIGPAGLDQIKGNRQFFGVNNTPFEYVIKKKGETDIKELKVNNPFYKYGVSNLSSSFASIINANSSITSVNRSYISFIGADGKTTNSPYLLYPGDRISLFVSKYHASEDNRPIIDLNNPTLAAAISQSVLKHDIKINTGSIKISLFGSYIKEGKSYVPPRVEPSTANISRVIGDDPVLDQLELYEDTQLMGTYTDNIVLPMSGALMKGKDYTTNVKDYPFINGHSRMRVSSTTYGKIITLEERYNDYTTTLIKKN